MQSTMENTSGREIWIDVAKGFGIALVVLGHTAIPPLAMKYLCMFHMPLFFFLSGLLYKDRPIAEMIARRVRRLVVPYFAFSLAAFLIYNVLITHSWQDLSHYRHQLLGVLYGTPDGPYGLTVFPLWFLLSLFLAHVMFSCILFVSRDRPMRAAVLVLALTALGFLNSKTLRLAAPWSAASSLVGVLFLALGYACRDHVARIEAIKTRHKIVMVVLLSGVVLVTALMNEPVVMARGSYGIIPVFLLGALSGTVMVVLLSMLVQPMRRAATMEWRIIPTSILTYLGRNTLTILAMHVPAAALAAHWLAGTSALPNPVLNDLAGKVLAGLLLLAAIELVNRSPRAIPRKSTQVTPSPL